MTRFNMFYIGFQEVSEIKVLFSHSMVLYSYVQLLKLKAAHFPS